jgi:hypothetical protein
VYVAPAIGAVFKINCAFSHTGEFEVTTGVVGVAFTVIVSAFDVTVGFGTQEKLEVNTQVTTAPLFN